MRIGVDLGGTKIEAVALGADATERARHRVPTPTGGYAETIDSIAGLVAEVEARAGARAPTIGVGIPGSLSPVDGLVRNANSTALNGHALDQDLEGAFGRPVRLENDANCFALAEAVAGAGRGYETVFGVILGTGVGAGIVTAGRVLRGANLIGGEWGHNPLPAPNADELTGPDCYCGRRGCIETWCSGPGLAADHLRRTGADMTAEMIAGVAGAGDMDARETMDLHLDRLGRGLAGVVNILDPDVIVLGGGLSNLDHLYDGLPQAMRPQIFSDVFQTPVLKNRLGDSAGVIGAAWLWPEEDA